MSTGKYASIIIAIAFLTLSADLARGEDNSSQWKRGVELLGGVGGVILGDIVGSIVVGVALSILDIDEEDVVRLFPLGVVLACGSAYGSAAGVSGVGHTLQDTGSFKWAFVGGLIPSLTGAVLGLSGERRLEPFHCPIIGALLGSFASPFGATIGYALSQRPQSSEMQGSVGSERNVAWEYQRKKSGIRISRQ